MSKKELRKEFIEKRLDYIEKKICKTYKEINEIDNKLELLFHEIKDKLPSKYKNLIHEYDILINHRKTIEGEIKYKIGISDGIKIKSVRYLCGKSKK